MLMFSGVGNVLAIVFVLLDGGVFIDLAHGGHMNKKSEKWYFYFFMYFQKKNDSIKRSNIMNIFLFPVLILIKIKIHRFFNF